MDFLAFLAERRRELLELTGQHVVLVLVATGIAIGVGVPLGITMTRSPRLARPLLAVSNVAQTIPSLALFGFLIPVPLIGGIGARSAVVALVLYALLPILRNTYTGILQVDRAVLEAATGMGMTAGQRLRMVELPLALPVILAGARVATVVSVGTATIAAAIGAGGLGTYVFRGLATVDTRLILAGAIPSALLALLADGLLGAVERARRPARAVALLATGAAAVVALALVARGCRTGSAPGVAGARPVVIGSKNFTEQVVLGEILGALLEDRGWRVERRLNLGGTILCHGAVRAGQIDLYVEYTGTALTEILKRPVHSDAADVLREVRQRYAELGLRLGEPLGFNNSYALAMRRTDARRLGIVRISDLAAHAARIRVGLFGEFLEREDGMPGLVRTYGLRFGPPPREMDLGLIYQSLSAGQVDLVVGSATDGLIAALDLVVLEDDRHYFPPYDAVAVMNEDSLAAHPGLAEAVGALSGRIDEASMRRMNHAVDGEHRAPAAVAREFLSGAGLLRTAGGARQRGGSDGAQESFPVVRPAVREHILCDIPRAPRPLGVGARRYLVDAARHDGAARRGQPPGRGLCPRRVAAEGDRGRPPASGGTGRERPPYGRGHWHAIQQLRPRDAGTDSLVDRCLGGRRGRWPGPAGGSPRAGPTPADHLTPRRSP